MINPQEYRIGNWIEYDTHHGQIDQADFADKSFWSKACPIPLTKEWLLKLGFYQGDTSSVFLDINEKTFLEGGKSIVRDYRVTCVCGGNYFGNNLLYVHQIQNLYFALTGAELQVKDFLTPNP